MSKVVTRREAVEKIRRREEFRIGTKAFYGTIASSVWDYGRLPDKYRDLWNTAVGVGAYAVYSYATPILWILPDGTVVEPPVRYSATTSRHQSYARQGAHIR